MRKVLKLFGFVVGGLLLLVIATAVIVPLVVDVNDYKPKIESAVEDATGRELTIAGDIELSLFPWVGVEIGEIRVGNADGFDEQAFAELEAAEVRVKLLPLLGREVVVDEIIVESPVVRLQRNPQGVGNWEDLAKGTSEPAAEKDEKGGPALEKLEIGGLKISNARFEFDDQAAGLSATLEKFDLRIGSIALPVDTTLEASGRFRLNAPEVAGEFSMNTNVFADLENQVFSLRDGQLDLSAAGAAIPVQPLDIELSWQDIVTNLSAGTADVTGLAMKTLDTESNVTVSITQLLEAPRARGAMEFSADDLEKTGAALGDLVPAGISLTGQAGAGLEFEYDQAAGTAALHNVLVEAMGVKLDAEASVSQLPSAPEINGRVELAEFSPVRLMSRLGVTLPSTSDDTVLEKAALQARFDATPTSVSMTDLEMILDDSKVSGSLAVTDFEKQALRFDLALDAIDVDRYLPPAAQDQPKEAAGGDINAMEIPVEPLRGLDIVGHLAIGKMKAVGFRSHDIEIGLNAQDDTLRIHPATARFYDGGYRGDIRIDASGKRAKFSIDEHLETVQLGPMLQDVLDVAYISGSARMDITATAAGKTVGDVRKSLNGELAAIIKDGTLEGFNLWESIRKAYATIQGKPYTPKDSAERTEFTELQATGTIRNGVFRNDKLDMRLPFLRVNGQGDIDLVQETLDYRVDAKIVSSAELEGGLDDLRGITIPIRLTGPLTSPKVRPELDEALKAKAMAELEKKKAEAEAEARRRLEEEKRKLEEKKKQAEEEAKKKVEDELKDKLKGLFD